MDRMGRKAQTARATDKSLAPWGGNSIDTARNLAANDLAAVIFGCTHTTMKECFANKLFGLPNNHILYVRNIKPGLPLFLFNYSDRKLHGIFESVCTGRSNINPEAWTEDGSDCPFPAQVKFQIRAHCQPLLEDQFGPIINQNYYSPRLFWFELDKDQANGLIALFSSSPMTLKEINYQKALFGSNVRGKQHLELQIHDKIRKQHNEIGHVNTSSGISYSSIVKNTVSSVASVDSSCPTITIGTSQKTWSALFNEEAIHDSKTRAEKSSIPTSEWYDSIWDDPNSQMGPAEAVTGDDSGNRGNVVVGDRTQDANDFGMPVDQNNWSWEEENEPEEVHNNGDDSSKGEEHLYSEELDGDYSLYSSVANMVLVESSPEEAAKVNSRATIVQSPEFYAVVSKLVTEVQELKDSQSMQSQKLSLLEQELIASRQQIQQLKESYKMLKSNNLYFEESIFIAGGFDGSAWFSSLDSYSPFEDVKKPLAPMSSLRAHATAVNLNGELYVLGGMQGNFLYDQVESYNPSSNKWVSHPPLIQKKGHMGGVSLGNKIYSIGGGNELQHYAEVEMLDVNAERWILVRSMLEKRYAPAAAELGGAIYAVGGYNAKGLLDTVERFDPREPSWNQLPRMNERRGFHSLAVLNDKLYALGGFDGQNMLSSVEIFDPRLGSWMIGESMANRRGYFGAFVMRDSIYVMGGLNETGGVTDTLVECYKEAGGWQSTDLKGIGKRCFFAAAVL
ncbi:DCD (Development and Cell Death) domain protein [Euphorbia peplus]|nr:DCD (Development and Cell Death) domain protein [Euphorbia peplus]